MIVFDASSIVGAALKENSTPERALLWARTHDVIALSPAVEEEIRSVLSRPKFAAAISAIRRTRILDLLFRSAVFVEPAIQVCDCRDAKDNKHLELALAAQAETIVSSDEDLTILNPWRGVQVLTPVDYLERSVSSGAHPPLPHN